MPTIFSKDNPETYPPLDTPVLAYYLTFNHYKGKYKAEIFQTVLLFEKTFDDRTSIDVCGIVGYDFEPDATLNTIVAWEALSKPAKEIVETAKTKARALYSKYKLTGELIFNEE